MPLRETLERIRSSPAPDNEEAAKFRILAPIMADLAWDPFGQDVLWEHPVGGKKSRGRVDIALQAEGRIRALIEAKAPGANLAHHVEQVLGYAFHEGVDICVLSNGLQWWLYLPREPGAPEERCFSTLKLDEDPIDQISHDLDVFLGRESLLGGRAVERAGQVRRALREAAHLEQEMPEIWQRMLTEPDSELIELIGQRVYDRLSLRPGREQIVAAIRNKPIPPRTAEPQESAPAEQRTAPETQPPRERGLSKITPRPAAILLWGERHPVKTHIEILMTVVEELHRRHPHDFDRSVEMPNIKNQYVSRDRNRVSDKNMRQTPSGHYVDLNVSAADVRRRAVRLLEALGHRGADLEYVYEQEPPAPASTYP